MTHLRRHSSWRGGFAVIALCLLAPVLAAQRTHPTPAPILGAEWGMSVDSLMATARAGGWTFMAIDEDGDYAFHGSLDGEEALVFATMGSNGLTQLLVSVTPHASAEVTFRRLADTLRTHFGPAALTTSDDEIRPAPSMILASAWQGILMGLRRDRRIMILFTCPAASPELPIRSSKLPIA